MPVESSTEGTVASEQPAPDKGAVEQKGSMQDILLNLAKEEGMIESKAAVPPEESEAAKETESPEEDEVQEVSTPEPPADEEEEPAKDEEKEEKQPPAAEKPKADKQVPLREVVEQRELKRKAEARAKAAEEELQARRLEVVNLQNQLQRVSGPQPTPDNPLADVWDKPTLNRMKKEWRALITTDIDQVDEEGMVTLPSGWDQNGQTTYRKFAPEQAAKVQKKAEQALALYVPDREALIDQRAKANAEAAAIYPDLANPESEFTKLSQTLEQAILSGNAISDPELKRWCADAVYGRVMRQQHIQEVNGNATKADNVKKLAEASKTKIAPSASRTRISVERKQGSDLAKKEEEFIKKRNTAHREEAALDYLNTLRSAQQGSQKQQVLKPVAE